jgi:hypothetical protein
MSGNAQALQLEITRTIAKTLGEPNPPVHVLFVATDGDMILPTKLNLRFGFLLTGVAS